MKLTSRCAEVAEAGGPVLLAEDSDLAAIKVLRRQNGWGYVFFDADPKPLAALTLASV
jgi:hypothetical protein